MQVTTVGLDLAKTIFHVHGVTEGGEVAFSRPLRRAQVLAFSERLRGPTETRPEGRVTPGPENGSGPGAATIPSETGPPDRGRPTWRGLASEIR